MRWELVVDGHAQPEALQLAIKKTCKTLLNGWRDLLDDQIETSFISGGISNALFKVVPLAAAAAGPLSPVAFRVYGDSTEHFVDRNKEIELMKLVHQNGFGPELLAVFGNGRIEEFLPMRSLQPEEMAQPDVFPIIAASLRRFHDIPAPGAKEGRTPFDRIYEWLDIAQNFTFDDPQKQEQFATFDFAALRAEVKVVQQGAAGVQSPIVFSHNDLLSGNIMVPLTFLSGAPSRSGTSGGPDATSRRHSTMTFIDFEYADWAPRGFDWGNHFCEYAGFECDYTRYPDASQAAAFIAHYLAAGGSASRDIQAVGTADMARYVAEANVYALAAHQYWGTWALLQAKWSSIDFDYLSYARLRWGEYQRRKEEFLAEAVAAWK